MLKSIAALVFFISLVPLAGAGDIDIKPCYGREEWQLARQLLDLQPLVLKLELNREEAQLLRDETCGAVGPIETLTDPRYDSFATDSGWQPIMVAAMSRGLKPLLVQAAMVDLHWGMPAKKKKTI